MIPRRPRPVPPPSLRKPKPLSGSPEPVAGPPANKPAKPPRPKKPRKPYKPDPALYWRFPDGTRFEGLHYTDGKWACVLCVPDATGTHQCFHLSTTGYEKMGRLAKTVWLAWLEEQKQKGPADSSPR